MVPHLRTIVVLFLSQCMWQHIVAAQRSTSVPFLSQSDSCNVVQVNCGGTQQNNDEKQEINRSPGSPGKLGPAGPMGPRGLKGEMGNAGLKGEKGKNVDVNLLKYIEILKTLGAENCRGLNVDHGVNVSGYYIMRSGNNGELRYNYCDFKIYQGAENCRELNVDHGANVSGYYIMRSGNTGELQYHYCDFKIYQGVTNCDELFTTYGKNQFGFYRFEADSSHYHYCSDGIFTCHQLRQHGVAKSGSYSLGKRGQIYEVNCHFYPNGNATTEVKHDSMTETEVKCENPGCYSKAPRYNINSDQILQIINNSQNCRQFIKYRCKGSVLRGNYAWWVSRDGEKMTYWGQTRKNGYCTCGETGNCIDSNHKCNCDQNSGDITTQDEGYLTDKTKLPVRELRYGDAGDSTEHGWHTLGQLECSG